MTNNDMGPVYGLFFAVILTLLLLSSISNTYYRILISKAVKNLHECFSDNGSFNIEEIYPQNDELSLPEFNFSKGE